MARSDLPTEDLKQELNVLFEAARQQLNLFLYPRIGDRERAAERLKEMCD